MHYNEAKHVPLDTLKKLYLLTGLLSNIDVHALFLHRFPKQLLQANDCSVAGKLQPLSPKDIPATLMRKIKAIIGVDGTHCSFSKAYRVVRQSEFYYSMEYTKCRKRNGYTVSYQKLNGHKDCFGHIQFFVLVQPSMCVLAIIQPLVIDLVCEKFCHLIPVKAVERYMTTIL